MTLRQQLAQEFVLVWLYVCHLYERKTYLDIRVQRARKRYLAAVANECWKRAA